MKIKNLLVLLLSLTLLPLHAAEVTVFAAASLTDSLKEIAAAYEKQSGDKITFNFGASSTLARQIQEGAPADLFFSADEAKMNALEQKGLIDVSTRKSVLGNTLVVVVPSDSKLVIDSPTNLAGTGVSRIALADPKAVPAGIYAQAWLQKAGLWDALGPKVIPTDNVRAALAAVESGNVDAAVVYKTDAAISKKVRVAYEVPAHDAPDISYPLALIKGSKQPGAAHKFLDHLMSDEAGSIFKRYSFTLRKQP